MRLTRTTKILELKEFWNLMKLNLINEMENLIKNFGRKNILSPFAFEYYWLYYPLSSNKVLNIP